MTGVQTCALPISKVMVFASISDIKKEYKFIFMTLKRINLVFLLLLLPTIVYAIAIEPKEIVFENVLNEGYAEKIIKISELGPVHVTLSATSPIKPWIKFEPIPTSANNKTSEYKIIVSPSNATIGMYQGYIIIDSISLGNEITTAISRSTTLKTTISITDEEITQANVKEVVVVDVEINNPVKVSVTVQNKGNIAVNTLFKIDILDSSKTQTLKTAQSNQISLLPLSTNVIETEIPNNLVIGKYYADITVHAEDMLLRKHLLSFDVIGQGTLPAKEEKETIKVYPEPIPLSANWFVLITWALILVFIAWKLTKHNYNGK